MLCTKSDNSYNQYNEKNCYYFEIDSKNCYTKIVQARR